MTTLSEQIDQLANVIMHEIPGEPSRSEGAVDTAIRLLRRAYVNKETEFQHPTPNEERHRENAPLTALPRVFILQREIDSTGISGVGVVAWGVEFPDGVCAVRWTAQWPTSVVFHERGMASIEAIHGHVGQTKITYIDEEADRNARAYGYEIGKGRPLVAILGEISEDNPFINPDWRDTIEVKN